MTEAQRSPDITLQIQTDMGGHPKNSDLHCHTGLVLYEVVALYGTCFLCYKIHLRQRYTNFPKINIHLKI
jgi:hypothetical protein